MFHIRGDYKQKEASVYAVIEQKFAARFAQQQADSMTKFKEEVQELKLQFRYLKRDQYHLVASVQRMERLAMSAEKELTRLRIACQLGDIENIYDTFQVDIPRKLKVALFLIYQFEHSDFNFSAVTNEELLQDQIVQLEEERLILAAQEAGAKLVKQRQSKKPAKKDDFRARYKAGEKKEEEQKPQEYYVWKAFAKRSYLGDACKGQILSVCEKMMDTEKQVQHDAVEKANELEI